MNSTKTTLTDFTSKTGDQIYAGPGAAAQTDDIRPMKVCGTCQSYVVFVKSNKTGNYYLADCFKGQGDGFYYVKASPHFKTCQKRQIEREIFFLEQEIKSLSDKHAGQADAIHDLCVETGNNDALTAFMLRNRAEVNEIRTKIQECRDRLKKVA